MPVFSKGNRMSKLFVPRVAPWILKLSRPVARPLNLAALCLVAAAFLPVAKAEAQCVDGAPDGMTDVTESCDDGNSSAGDGCTNSCTIEPEWSAANAITFSTAALSTNDYPGSSASWTFAADNSWTTQTVNTNAPTIGLFGVDAMRGTYALELEVETTADDDFIGIVFGFNDGDTSNLNADYLLLDWKQQTQTVGASTGLVGLALSHVQGIPDGFDDFWPHRCPAPGTTCVKELARAASLASAAWTDNFGHIFHVTYRADRLLVMVDGFVQFDVSPSDFPGEFAGNVFPAGEIGFYSFSQASSTTRNIGTIGPSVLNKTTVSDGDVYVTTGSGTTTVDIVDFFSDADDSLNGNMILVTGVTGAATTDDPAGDAATGTIELTPDDDAVPTSYAVTYTACDDHPVVPDCDTATVTVHYEIACGNGIIETGETCDDGNTTAGDGCTNCLLDAGGGCMLNSDCVGTCIAGLCAPAAGAGGACDTNDDEDCTGALACNAAGTCGGDGAVCSANEDCVNTCIGSVCAPSGTLGDSCDAGDSGDCTGALDCDESGTCGGDGAVCSANAECINTCIGSVCAPTSGVGGTCDASDGADCTGALGCDGSGTCGGDGAGCAANEDCVNTCIGSACAPTGSLGGACDAGDTGDCTSALDCDASGVCGGNGAVCSGNADCVNTCIGSFCGNGAATGETCDTDDDADCASGICVGATCEACEDDQANPGVDNGCDAETPFCLTSGGAGAFECIECVASNDCGFGSFCNATNACETGCEFNTDCGGGTPACDLSQGSPGVCAVCVNDQAGTAEDNGCSAALGASLCAISTTTEASTNGAGTECRACLDSAQGTAVDFGCAGATPFCDVSGSGICLGCVDDSNCPGAQVCAAGSLCAFPDVDGDGIPADVDVDDDNDGVPDDVEGGGTDYSQDGDDDGVPDFIDPDAVSCDDANLDGFCDSLPAEVDLDGDGIPNHLDADADDDGIPDATEAHDADGDGLADVTPVDNDFDMDGLDDAFDPDCEGMPPGCLTDGMGAPTPDRDDDGSDDYLDGDSDNDGRPDQSEAFDANGDGDPDVVPSGVDADMDGLDDAFDTDQAGVGPTGQDVDGDGRPDYIDLDSDGDGISDAAECPDPTQCTDTDGDGVIDALELDSDNDGIGDLIEGHDGDGDGLPDFAPLGRDDDEDGMDDGYDGDMSGGVTAPLPDSDDDGVPDFQDPGDDDGTDSDGDGISDFVECNGNPATCQDTDEDGLADHLDRDSDGDGIEDVVECGGSSCADTDGDGRPDFQDPDSDDDGFSDLLEGHDANMDGVADTTPDGSDTDGDGLDDAFDPDNGGASAPVQDSDEDSTPDFQDTDDDDDGIDSGFESSPDHLNDSESPTETDGDGIPDLVECAGGDPVGAPLECPDSDGDGTPDFQDPDDDDDGIDTAAENYDGDGDPRDQDSDRDGIADYLDADDDGDGLATDEECSSFGAGCLDTDGDGVADYLDVCGDGTRTSIDIATGWEECDDGNSDDGDGCSSSCRFESTPGDADGDGISDDLECPAPGNPAQPDSCRDSDDDQTPDFEDEDDDGDGVDTRDESPDGNSDPTDDDTDGDGTPNYLDEDDDGDGVDTADEIAASDATGDDDPDGDGLVNWLDTDSDGDGVDDGDEAGDENGNGIADYLEDLDEAQDSGRLILQGGRGVGCTVGAPGQGGPNGVLLLLMLGFGLGIRRYRRN